MRLFCDRRPRTSALLLGLVLGATTPVLNAGLIVNATLTPLGSGVIQYDFSISNPGPKDVFLVSITDAPASDALIPATLAAPAGFQASYDPGIGLSFGIVDFVEDTSLFAVGSTITGFRFQSAAPLQGYFTTFEAIGDDGLQSGTINRAGGSTPPPQAAPESGGTLLLAGLSFLGLALSSLMARSRAAG